MLEAGKAITADHHPHAGLAVPTIPGEQGDMRNFKDDVPCGRPPDSLITLLGACVRGRSRVQRHNSIVGVLEADLRQKNACVWINHPTVVSCPGQPQPRKIRVEVTGQLPTSD